MKSEGVVCSGACPVQEMIEGCMAVLTIGAELAADLGYTTDQRVVVVERHEINKEILVEFGGRQAWVNSGAVFITQAGTDCVEPSAGGGGGCNCQFRTPCLQVNIDWFMGNEHTTVAKRLDSACGTKSSADDVNFLGRVQFLARCVSCNMFFLQKAAALLVSHAQPDQYWSLFRRALETEAGHSMLYASCISVVIFPQLLAQRMLRGHMSLVKSWS